jgi:hypothetical protein
MELALAGTAGRLIPEAYLPRAQCRFAEPAGLADSTFAATNPAPLAETLCIEEQRIIGA